MHNRETKGIMSPVGPNTTRTLSPDDHRQFEAVIQDTAGRLSAAHLAKLLKGVTWNEFVAFLRDTCPQVQGLPDSDLECLFHGFRRVLTGHLASVAGCHRKVGTA
jgi:hypothetical protein